MRLHYDYAGNGDIIPDNFDFVWFHDLPDVGNLKFLDYMASQLVIDPGRYRIVGGFGSRQLLDRGVVIATEIPRTAGVEDISDPDWL